MKTIKTSDVQPFENPHGVDGRKLFISDNIQIVRLTLKPGETIQPHSAPIYVFFFVVEGEGICESGDESIAVSKDTLIFSTPGTIQGWRNTGTGELKLLVSKVVQI
ncbi:MAG: cupin domain-containing protein [Ignavibacteria bacterium]|nr:cupin domain-containing protein [Ignavibacteria bacterium]